MSNVFLFFSQAPEVTINPPRPSPRLSSKAKNALRAGRERRSAEQPLSDGAAPASDAPSTGSPAGIGGGGGGACEGFTAPPAARGTPGGQHQPPRSGNARRQAPRPSSGSSTQASGGAGGPRGSGGESAGDGGDGGIPVVPPLATGAAAAAAHAGDGPSLSSPEPGSARTGDSDADLGKMGSEAAARYQRARLSVLQQQVAHLAGEGKELAAALAEAEKRVKSEAEERAKLSRSQQALHVKLEKEASGRAQAEAEAERLRTEVASLRRDAEAAARQGRSADGEARARDVRLQRALEDAAKAKNALATEKAKRAEDGNVLRQGSARLEAKVARLERQKAELLGAFKKQLKLIDVLRRQKVHVEAARVLAFTEEEFMKTLDWYSPFALCLGCNVLWFQGDREDSPHCEHTKSSILCEAPS